MSKVILKTKDEIELIRESALIVSETLGMLASEIIPGVTTLKLDKLAESFIRDNGAKPGFLGLYDFPNTLCVSPNSQVVHGLPNNTPLKDGDIVSAAQEERFSRKKHDSRYPFNSVKYILEENHLKLSEIDHVVFFEKPFLKFERLLETYLAFAPKGFKSFSLSMPIWLREKLFQKKLLF